MEKDTLNGVGNESEDKGNTPEPNGTQAGDGNAATTEDNKVSGKGDKGSSKSPKNLWNYIFISLMVTGITGILAVALGLRDNLVMVTTIMILIFGGYSYYRKKKEVQKPNKLIWKILVTVLILVNVPITVDNVRLGMNVGGVVATEGKYTTVDRCKLSGGVKLCLHESEQAVKLYAVRGTKVLEVEDITKEVEQYVN